VKCRLADELVGRIVRPTDEDTSHRPVRPVRSADLPGGRPDCPVLLLLQVTDLPTSNRSYSSTYLVHRRNDHEAYQSVAVEQVESCNEDVADKESHPLKVDVYLTSDKDPDPSGYITRVIKKVYQSIRNV
jgi:hypothetical protein